MQEDDWWTESIAGFDVAVGRPDTLCGWVVGQVALHMETLTEEQVYDIRFNDDGNDGMSVSQLDPHRGAGIGWSNT